MRRTWPDRRVVLLGALTDGGDLCSTDLGPDPDHGGGGRRALNNVYMTHTQYLGTSHAFDGMAWHGMIPCYCQY